MDSLIFNEQEIEAKPGENLIQAARRAGIEIPHYCWHPDLSVVASCRMCLVEVGERKPDGSVAMLPRLVPACQTPAKPNTVVKTATDKVKSSQAQTLEYLLLNHPLDCSICDQAGECYLQDYTYKFGNAHSRLNEPKVQRLDKYHIGDQIALFTDRCVMCTRCVRFTREVSGTAELHVINRGSVEEIDVVEGHECNNKLAGNVVDLCPVGALCSKDFLYKKRVWWLKTASSVCAGCSTGCSISLDQNENRLYRMRPRSNPLAQGEFICDEGRFGWKYVHSEHRLTKPRKGREGSANVLSNGNHAKPGDQLNFDNPWKPVLEAARQEIRRHAKEHAESFAVLFSPFMTCEEAYLLASWVKSLDKRIALVMGKVPIQGEDDLYPKGHDGSPPPADRVRFTIRKEKCPNRRGVEEVLKHFQEGFLDFDAWSQRLAQGKWKAAYVVAGYPEAWLDDATMNALSQLELLVVQDFARSKLTDKADFLFANATFAERDGTFVNHAGLAQSLTMAVRPPGDAWSDGRILVELSERRGLYHSASVRKEMAESLTFFRALAKSCSKEQSTSQGTCEKHGEADLGEYGVRLLP